MNASHKHEKTLLYFQTNLASCSYFPKNSTYTYNNIEKSNQRILMKGRIAVLSPLKAATGFDRP